MIEKLIRAPGLIWCGKGDPKVTSRHWFLDPGAAPGEPPLHGVARSGGSRMGRGTRGGLRVREGGVHALNISAPVESGVTGVCVYVGVGVIPRPCKIL